MNRLLWTLAALAVGLLAMGTGRLVRWVLENDLIGDAQEGVFLDRPIDLRDAKNGKVVGQLPIGTVCVFDRVGLSRRSCYVVVNLTPRARKVPAGPARSYLAAHE